MNDRQKQYLNSYCGMWEARAQVLADIEEGKKVNGASYKHFVDAGSIAEDGRLNTWGMVLLARVMSIMDGSFIPEAPFMPEETLHAIDATRAARWAWIKEGHYLRSSDLKALRNVALTPGAVYCSFVPGFGHVMIRSLITRGYVKAEGHQPTEGWNAMDYCRLFLTIKGENLARNIVNYGVRA
jgi:hypothetical protein